MSELFLHFHSSVPFPVADEIRKNVRATGFSELQRGRSLEYATFIVVMCTAVNAVPAQFFNLGKLICIQRPHETPVAPAGAHVFDINSMTRIDGEHPGETLSQFLTRHAAAKPA